MKRSDILAAGAMFILCSVLLAGCAPRALCYGLVGVNPQVGTAIVFDQCTGRVFYEKMPPPPAPPPMAEREFES